MEGLYLSQRFRNWIISIALVMIGGGWLIFNDEPINRTEPIVEEKPGRSAELDFVVKKSGTYQFALLFSTGYLGSDDIERQRQLKLFGNVVDKGQAIPVSLRVIKDGKLFLDERIETTGIERHYDFYRRNFNIHAMVRNIKLEELPPGNYSAEITLLKDIPDFERTNLYAHVVYYTPENLARLEKEYLKEKDLLDTEWYMMARMAGAILHHFYCKVFCPAPVDIVEHLDVTNAGQQVNANFNVSESGDYKFSLLFDLTDDSSEMDRRDDLLRSFGSAGIKSGLPIPLSMRVTRDNKTYFETEIITMDINGWTNIYYKDIWVKVAGRQITSLELTPGRYSVVITTLENIPELKGIDCFFNVIRYQHK